MTTTIKTMIEGALTAAGGKDFLAQQAKESPAVFLKLVGRLLPKDTQFMPFSERMQRILDEQEAPSS